MIKTKIVQQMSSNEVIDKKTCDMCGKSVKKNLRYGNDKDWDTEDWDDILETCVYIKEGITYTNGTEGNGKELRIDICPDCFKDKLIPWLESQGVKLEWKEWDY